MKKYNLKFLLILFMMVILTGMSDKKASAYKIKVKIEKTGPYAEKIEDEMFALAKKKARHLLAKRFKDKQEYGFTFQNMGISKKDTFILCKPYVYWHYESRQYAQYIFPIAVKNEVIAVLEVNGRIEEPDYVDAHLMPNEDKLNELNYLHKDYVFYPYQGTIVAEDVKGEITELRRDFNEVYSPSEEKTESEAFFHALNYDKKMEIILEKMDNFLYEDELKALVEENTEPTAVPSTFIPREATPEPDTSTKENFDNFDSILPVVAVSVIVTVLVIVFVIVKIKKTA